MGLEPGCMPVEEAAAVEDRFAVALAAHTAVVECPGCGAVPEPGRYTSHYNSPPGQPDLGPWRPLYTSVAERKGVQRFDDGECTCPE